MNQVASSAGGEKKLAVGNTVGDLRQVATLPLMEKRFFGRFFNEAAKERFFRECCREFDGATLVDYPDTTGLVVALKSDEQEHLLDGLVRGCVTPHHRHQVERGQDPAGLDSGFVLPRFMNPGPDGSRPQLFRGILREHVLGAVIRRLQGTIKILPCTGVWLDKKDGKVVYDRSDYVVVCGAARLTPDCLTAAIREEVLLHPECDQEAIYAWHDGRAVLITLRP